jgi:hypothetical protein
MDHWDILRNGRDHSLPVDAVLLTRGDFATYPQLDHNQWMSDKFAAPTIDAQQQAHFIDTGLKSPRVCCRYGHRSQQQAHFIGTGLKSPRVCCRYGSFCLSSVTTDEEQC